MKKTILFFILFSLISYAEVDIGDYEIFLKGRTEFEKENYLKANKLFSEIIINYPKSTLIRSSFINYYIGVTKFKLKNFEEAIAYLEKSKYHKYEKNYILGLIYDYSDKNLAKEFFLKLYLNNYIKNNEKYEKMALQHLIAYDPYFAEIYTAKFSSKKANMEKIKVEDIEKIGDYFYSFGNYKTAIRYYKAVLNKDKKDIVELKLLKTYYNQKEYEKAYIYAEKILVDNIYISQINYFAGISYKRDALYKKAIRKFENVKSDKMKKKSNLEIAKIHYVLAEYEKAISIFKKIKQEVSKEYLIKIYKKKNNEKQYINSLIDYIKTYPYSDKSAYYRFILYEKKNQKSYLDWILYYNIDSYYYELAYDILKKENNMKTYNLNKRYKKYNDLVNKLDNLSKIKFYEACRLEIDYNFFNKEDQVFKTYLKTKYYEKTENYYLAIKNSYYNPYKFARYDNLRKDLYPIYYNEYVEKYSKLYNIDKYLVYSVIKQESLFNSNEISHASAYGLMQVLVPTAKMFDKSMTEKKLLNPEENIKIGVQYLSYLMKKFDNNLNEVIAAYNAGPGNVNKWLIRYGEIEIEKIPFSETKTYVKKVLNNYYKYKRLYGDKENI